MLLLGSIPQERLEEAAQDEAFLAHLDRVGEGLREYVFGSGTWYQKPFGPSDKPVVAYFSMEFGLTECLPVYSGGLGILAGLASGFLVAQMKIPAFVATLAGWLGYRGALQLATAATGTISISDETFNSIANGFIPDIPDFGFLDDVHKVTLLLGVVAIILFITGAINERRRTQS